VIKAVQKPKLPAPMIFSIRASTAREAFSTMALGSGCLLVFKAGSFDIRVRPAAPAAPFLHAQLNFGLPAQQALTVKGKQTAGQLEAALKCRNSSRAVALYADELSNLATGQTTRLRNVALRAVALEYPCRNTACLAFGLAK
jgi:hypothetical protein